MKKTMLLAAAALVGMCGTAMATTTTVQLSSYCDEYTITSNTAPLYAIYGVNSDCDPGIGGGMEGKAKGGKLLTTGMELNSVDSPIWVSTFTLPLKKGGTATLYDTFDGITLTYVTDSAYTVVTPGSRRNSNLKPATQARN